MLTTSIIFYIYYHLFLLFITNSDACLSKIPQIRQDISSPSRSRAGRVLRSLHGCQKARGRRVFSRLGCLWSPAPSRHSPRRIERHLRLRPRSPLICRLWLRQRNHRLHNRVLRHQILPLIRLPRNVEQIRIRKTYLKSAIPQLKHNINNTVLQVNTRKSQNKGRYSIHQIIRISRQLRCGKNTVMNLLQHLIIGTQPSLVPTRPLLKKMLRL